MTTVTDTAPWEDYKTSGVEEDGPWSDYKPQDAPLATPSAHLDELKSYLRGAAQGGTMGFADEGVGAAQALYNKLAGDPRSLIDLYTEGRDQARASNQTAETANPKSYLAGQLSGAVAPALLSGGTSIPALAAQGAIQGLGSSGADLTKGNIGGALKDTAIGGAVGGALGAAGSLISKGPYVGNLVGKAGDALKGGAEYLANAATGTEGLADDAGRTLLDKGLVRFGDTAKNIAERVSTAADSAGDDAALSQLAAPIKEAAAKPGFGATASLAPSMSDAAVFLGAGHHGYIAKKAFEKVIAPRALSSTAVLADNLGDAVKATPQLFGKFAAPLQAAAARGGTSLAATNFILQQTNPEYRSLVLGKDNENQDDQ